MWTNQRFFSAAVSGAVITAIAAVEINYHKAFALPSQTVNQIIRKSAVSIEGAGIGSGVIIAQDDIGYTVLTNHHVVESPGDYQIVTVDGQSHEAVDIVKLEGADLALVYFDTDKQYSVVARGDSDSLIEGQIVHIAGYPGAQMTVATKRTYRFLSESLSGFLAPSNINEGYELIYSGIPVPGMSGSPIVNQEAQLVGIYGGGERDLQTQADYLYGIPLNTALKIANRSGIELNPGQKTEPVKAVVNPPTNTPAADNSADAPIDLFATSSSDAPDLAEENSGNAGFEIIGSAEVNNFVIPEIIYTGECPGRSLQSQNAMFFSNTTTTAPDRRVVITNVTRGLKRDPLPYADREYDEGQVSEETEITFGSEHDRRNFVVLAGENQFQYEIVQPEENGDLETVLEQGSFKVTATKEEQLVERNKEPVEETYCPNDAKECEAEQEKVRTVYKCPGERSSSSSSSGSGSDSSLFDLFR